MAKAAQKAWERIHKMKEFMEYMDKQLEGARVIMVESEHPYGGGIIMHFRKNDKKFKITISARMIGNNNGLDVKWAE